MIHYSILPEEVIIANQTGKLPPYKEVTVEGVNMVIQLDHETEATIVRLLSANPMDYLDPRFQPGNKVQLFPKI